MKIDLTKLVKVAQRKGLSWAGAMVMGMVMCAIDDDLRALIQKYLALFGGGGGVAMAASTLWSLSNEGKLDDLKETATENLYRAPAGMKLVPSDATVIQAVKGDV